jgi:hypothetical protein
MSAVDPAVEHPSSQSAMTIERLRATWPTYSSDAIATPLPDPRHFETIDQRRKIRADPVLSMTTWGDGRGLSAVLRKPSARLRTVGHEG